MGNSVFISAILISLIFIGGCGQGVIDKTITTVPQQEQNTIQSSVTVQPTTVDIRKVQDECDKRASSSPEKDIYFGYDEFEYIDCISEMARKTNTPSLCDEITKTGDPDYGSRDREAKCWGFFAYINSDYSLCDNIDSETFKEMYCGQNLREDIKFTENHPWVIEYRATH